MKKENNYVAKFNRIMLSGEPIYNKDGKELILEDNEEFRQCYSNTPARRLFYPFWFISNKGNLISVYKKKPLWVYPDQNGCYYSFHLWNKEKQANKKIMQHTLVALVFGSEVVGKAQELLDQNGVYAFGNHKNDDNLQTHHIKQVKGNPDLVNDKDNLQIMTSKLHQLIEKEVPSFNDDEERHVEYIKKLDKVLPEQFDFDSEELAGKAIVILPPEKYDKSSGEWVKDDKCLIKLVDQKVIFDMLKRGMNVSQKE